MRFLLVFDMYLFLAKREQVHLFWALPNKLRLSVCTLYRVPGTWYMILDMYTAAVLVQSNVTIEPPLRAQLFPLQYVPVFG